MPSGKEENERSEVKENSTLKPSRATPKEGNRQNVLARFDKISQGARTEKSG
ncbi:hypothetical protein [uncultured Rikenella sp.]|uniref:hypothetical protein n=1 Tax=uncultured Rikenella sp. TaxID=368003 RepID=UPI002607C983|nr:hypothetical protein [uncultured Rikenella sp.]